MEINQSNQHFGALFNKSTDLENIITDSMKKGKFKKIKEAKRNIGKQDPSVRLSVNLFYHNEHGINYPAIIFSRFEPKNGIKIPKSQKDYNLTGITEYIADKEMDILTYGRRMIAKLGHEAPKNKMYKQVVKYHDPNFQEPKYDIFG